MEETRVMMDQMVQRIKSTKEYNQYQNLLRRVKEQPELYQRIGEYRRRSISVQMQSGEDAIAENNNLQKEFADLQSNGLAWEFLVSEHQYCGLIKQLQNQFLEGVQIDTSFLED